MIGRQRGTHCGGMAEPLAAVYALGRPKWIDSGPTGSITSQTGRPFPMSGCAAYAQFETMYTMALLSWQRLHLHCLDGEKVQTTPVHSFTRDCAPSVRLHRRVVRWTWRRH